MTIKHRGNVKPFRIFLIAIICVGILAMVVPRGTSLRIKGIGLEVEILKEQSFSNSVTAPTASAHLSPALPVSTSSPQ